MNYDTLIIDNHNIVFRTLGSDASPDSNANKDLSLDDLFRLWKSSYLKNIIELIDRVRPTSKVVIAQDYKSSWRKEIYPLYKHKRKGKRDKAHKNENFTMLAFFDMLDEFLGELERVLPQVQFMRRQSIEADDIIAVVTKNVPSNIMCISTDKDLYQLYSYPHYHQSTHGRKEVLVPNPKDFLHSQVCMGQRKDDIPAIYPRLGIKTYEKMMNSGELQRLIVEDETVSELYQRNCKLIDFNYIPKDVSDVIMKDYNSFDAVKHNEYDFYTFLIKHKLNFIINYYMNDANQAFKRMWEYQSRGGLVFS